MLPSVQPRDLQSRDAHSRAIPTTGPPRNRPRRALIRRRILFACAAIAAALHTLAVLWTWLAWMPGVRGTWLVWLDLPISLLYMHLVGGSLLARSLLLGGLQWAFTGALVAWLVGWAARRRRP